MRRIAIIKAGGVKSFSLFMNCIILAYKVGLNIPNHLLPISSVPIWTANPRHFGLAEIVQFYSIRKKFKSRILES